MKKLLITLDINYSKEITNITHPYMKSYANKIGADFKIITERNFPDQSVNMEKFQLYNLSKNYDWTIFIDSDAIIHPNCIDVTEIYEKDVAIFNAYDLYPIRFKPNNYSRRDKRNIGATTWFTAFSDWTRHIWKPYSNPKDYVSEINLTNKEKNFGYTSEHILDDYLVSRNIAKYGIKIKTIVFDFISQYPYKMTPLFLIHVYSVSLDKKISFLKEYDSMIKNEVSDINQSFPIFEDKFKYF